MVAILDKQLEEELRGYDKELQKELEKAETERQAQAAERQAAEQNNAGSEESLEEAEGEGSAEAAGEEESNEESGEELAKAGSQEDQPESGGENQQGGSLGGTSDRGLGSRSETPEDIPSGHDDDVVARQLREAAEKEQDPVLREKLWDEYRKYKNQQTTTAEAGNPSIKQ